ncbi:hypothetical protein PACTADRAFT_71693 [Pachysolen tannophilus NRRL Y-2460]|uniref:Mitochondrial carrier protein n=1 Tax=Pachysolen tannophilus NRRL Y-2460 TaxID=669874 RepID=A0A1E4TPX3_PACTA|nr:hypothetical protein PACTADRAFT_71693 [Pachysolen tannophilus NRRL Y-2460]
MSSITLSSTTIPYHHNEDQHLNSYSKLRSVPPDGEDYNSDKNRDEYASPLLHCMLAGGFGGAIGDSVMHSLDTVKTRQQGSPNTLKYKNMIPAFGTILKEEGFARGLYGGYGACMLGSFPSAATFFITYEYTKRKLINSYNVPDTITHLVSGFLGDFASSIFYVPSEVLKTRLQLQGRYNNPYFKSGYNYKSTFNAISTIIRDEGPKTLFFGYKATLFRDLPFSALQFAFYEKFRDYAFEFSMANRQQEELSIPYELITGAAAGGLAGIITTPLDVIKTRVQTQNPSASLSSKAITIFKGLLVVYRSEGFVGLFSGVGPRFIWTSIQSSIMLFLYQISLRAFDNLLNDEKKVF